MDWDNSRKSIEALFVQAFVSFANMTLAITGGQTAVRTIHQKFREWLKTTKTWSQLMEHKSPTKIVAEGLHQLWPSVRVTNKYAQVTFQVSGYVFENYLTDGNKI